jgi:hypothetical protein
MEREGVDAAIAFERLREVARSHHRTVVEVAGDVLAGVPLPSRPAGGSTRPGSLRSSPTSRRLGCMSGLPRCMSSWATPTGRGRSGSGPLGHGRGPSASGTARLDRRPHRGPDPWGAASRVQATTAPGNRAVVCTVWEVGGPRRGGRAGDRPRFACLTDRRSKQERIGSSEGAVAHRPLVAQEGSLKTLSRSGPPAGVWSSARRVARWSASPQAEQPACPSARDGCSWRPSRACRLTD